MLAIPVFASVTHHALVDLATVPLGRPDDRMARVVEAVELVVDPREE